MKAGTRRGAALPWATRSNARHAQHKPKDTEPFRALTVCTRHGKWEEATPQPGTQAPRPPALCSPSSAWPHLNKGGQGGSTPASRRGSRVAQVLAHIIPLTQVPHLRPTQNPGGRQPSSEEGPLPDLRSGHRPRAARAAVPRVRPQPQTYLPSRGSHWECRLAQGATKVPCSSVWWSSAVPAPRARKPPQDPCPPACHPQPCCHPGRSALWKLLHPDPCLQSLGSV